MLSNFVLGIFVDEVIHQCKFALMSWENLQPLLADLSRDWREVQDGVFWNVQSFLIAAANLSKFLWPKEQYEARGEKLREMLQIPTDSPIRKRYFRNVFEHYDNEIECWASSSTRKKYSDMNISIDGFSAIGGIDPIDNMRNLDISRDRKHLTLTFHGRSHDLTTAESAIRELLKRAEKSRSELLKPPVSR